MKTQTTPALPTLTPQGVAIKQLTAEAHKEIDNILVLLNQQNFIVASNAPDAAKAMKHIGVLTGDLRAKSAELKKLLKELTSE